MESPQQETLLPEPSPAPTLATPLFPGFFPATPSTDAYAQQEGPLEQAGRDLPNTSSPGSVILGAAGGFLLGGPVGAAMGASLLGLRSIEDEALAARHLGGKSEEQERERIVTPQQQELSDTPIGREVGGTVPVAVLAGAAGAVVMEFEAPEVKTEAEAVNAAGVQVEDEPSGVTVSPSERAFGEDRADALLLLFQTPTQARTPTEELKEDALSKQDKIILGAAGGVGAAALAGEAEVSPFRHSCDQESDDSLFFTLKETPEAVVTEVRSVEDAFASAQGVEDLDREATVRLDGWVEFLAPSDAQQRRLRIRLRRASSPLRRRAAGAATS